MDALQSIGIFAAEAFLIVIAIAAIVMVIAAAASKSQSKDTIQLELLHKKYKGFATLLKAKTLSKSERKEYKKKLKAEAKEQESKIQGKDKKVFVIDFDGDVKASAVENLREEITAVITLATAQDEVVVRVESPGGMVHAYGLAAAQLLRIHERNIPLTICVDKVAASGGYLMLLHGFE